MKALYKRRFKPLNILAYVKHLRKDIVMPGEYVDIQYIGKEYVTLRVRIKRSLFETLYKMKNETGLDLTEIVIASLVNTTVYGIEDENFKKDENPIVI